MSLVGFVTAPNSVLNFITQINSVTKFIPKFKGVLKTWLWGPFFTLIIVVEATNNAKHTCVILKSEGFHNPGVFLQITLANRYPV